MSRLVPRIVIEGIQSGTGKASISSGLKALRACMPIYVDSRIIQSGLSFRGFSPFMRVTIFQGSSAM